MIAVYETERDRRLVEAVLRLIDADKDAYGASSERMLRMEIAAEGHHATRLHNLVVRAYQVTNLVPLPANQIADQLGGKMEEG